MNKNRYKAARRQRRKFSIRKRVDGTPQRPRLTVFRSLNHCYAQVVDDYEGRTLVSASTLDKDLGLKATGNKDAAAAVGKRLAEKAQQAGVTTVVFDRNGFPYHGRVKALAEAAREAGLKF